MLQSDHPLSSRIKYFHYNELSEHIKPDPRVFDRTWQELGITPGEAVYVGDSPSDALACNLAGVHCIVSLESGLRSKADFQKFYVDTFVYSLAELDEAIIKLTKKWELLEDHEDASAEFLIEVDEKDEVIGPVARKITHNQTRKPWHRSTHAYLFDKEGNLYFTKRSASKDIYPGCWTISAAGHVQWGSDYEETVRREIDEELQVSVSKLEFVEKINIDYGEEREIVGVYLGICNAEPHFNTEEVSEITKFPLNQLIKDFQTGKFPC